MSANENEVLAAVQKLVEQQTFSLEALNQVQKVKEENLQLQQKITTLQQRIDIYEKSASDRNDTIRRLEVKITAHEAEKEAINKRSNELRIKELEYAKAQGELTGYKDVTGLVFRNLEVRQTMFGMAPSSPNTNPNQYNTPTVSVSEDRSVTAK